MARSIARQAIRLAALSLLLAAAAQARWKSQYANNPPEITEWFKSQHNANGQWCCDKSDGHRFYGNWELKQDGSVVADYHGMKVKIAKEFVLTGPNPVGSAVWWYYPQYEGGQEVAPHTYCFALGPMG